MIEYNDVRGNKQMIGESFRDAQENGLRFYLGQICPREHRFMRSNSSIRYTSSSNCVRCNKEKSMQREEYPDASARKRIEDLKLAQELGIDVSELD